MCCLECLIGDWAVTTVSTHVVGVFFCPSFVFAACQRLRFCQSPGFFLLQLVSRAGLHFPPMVWTAGVAAVMCQRPSRCVRCTSCEDDLRYNICYRTPRWAATVLG